MKTMSRSEYVRRVHAMNEMIFKSDETPAESAAYAIARVDAVNRALGVRACPDESAPPPLSKADVEKVLTDGVREGFRRARALVRELYDQSAPGDVRVGLSQAYSVIDDQCKRLAPPATDPISST